MAETVGSDDESEFGSVTSSQKSFLKNCPFAVPESPPTKSSGDLETTEILENPISPAATRTPILSRSTPMSLDSINDEDVFRTPPENASLSSAAESEQPRVMVSDMKLKSETTPVSASSPSLPPEKNLNLVSSSEGIKVSETDNDEIAIPFKQVIEALLRNSGVNLDERDDKVSYVDILKRFGLTFP